MDGEEKEIHVLQHNKTEAEDKEIHVHQHSKMEIEENKKQLITIHWH